MFYDENSKLDGFAAGLNRIHAILEEGGEYTAGMERYIDDAQAYLDGGLEAINWKKVGIASIIAALIAAILAFVAKMRNGGNTTASVDKVVEQAKKNIVETEKKAVEAVKRSGEMHVGDPKPKHPSKGHIDFDTMSADEISKAVRDHHEGKDKATILDNWSKKFPNIPELTKDEVREIYGVPMEKIHLLSKNEKLDIVKRMGDKVEKLMFSKIKNSKEDSEEYHLRKTLLLIAGLIEIKKGNMELDELIDFKANARDLYTTVISTTNNLAHLLTKHHEEKGRPECNHEKLQILSGSGPDISQAKELDIFLNDLVHAMKAPVSDIEWIPDYWTKETGKTIYNMERFAKKDNENITGIKDEVGKLIDNPRFGMRVIGSFDEFMKEERELFEEMEEDVEDNIAATNDIIDHIPPGKKCEFSIPIKKMESLREQMKDLGYERYGYNLDFYMKTLSVIPLQFVNRQLNTNIPVVKNFISTYKNLLVKITEYYEKHMSFFASQLV